MKLFLCRLLIVSFLGMGCAPDERDASRFSELSIEIFHGTAQRVGHLGDAQSDFNLMGRVTPPEIVRSLTYSLNGGLPQSLTLPIHADGFGDGKRLAANGDFNADIPIQALKVGQNRVDILTTDLKGRTQTTEVKIIRQRGTVSLPVHIHWSEVDDPQDVGQYIDGLWGRQGKGLRVMRSGYDRIFLIGERHWQDYEAMVSIIIHRVDRLTGPRSGPNGLGLIMRFTGHVNGGPREFPVAQPKYGYQPFGAIGWLRWTDGPESPPQKQFYRGDNDNRTDHGSFSLMLEKAYVMKMRCETLPDTPKGLGVTLYSWKMWPTGEVEPSVWAWQITQTSEHALRQGGIALLAHHVEATFGDLSVVMLPNN